MLTKIAQAKKYKQDAGTGSTAPVIAPTFRKEASDTQNSAEGSRSGSEQLNSAQLQASTPEQEGGSLADSATDADSTGASTSKSAVPDPNKAASFLRGITSKAAGPALSEEDKKLSPEKLSAVLNERKKQNTKVEIITVDQHYCPEGDGNVQYKPKVATWGVFPRPDNISKAFGGGRTIRPGEELEDQERRAARRAKTMAILAEYKKGREDTMDPVTEAAVQVLYDNGSELMRRGRLEAASEVFREATAMAAPMSLLGGDCKMQLAICLDSMSRSEDALPLYKQMTRHPQAHISKRARQMIFGIEAMDNLKTHTISYAAGAGAFQEYFTRLTSDYNVGYKKPEDAAPSNPWVLYAIFGLMVAPLGLIAWKVLLD
ncbi:hypothetical protein WJX73_004807 [Symbiochloris irregularis]|uniref:Uncharacterized protein n=1 Tax=Symbiochloris irregularis TaxID=706552 RepID=A0AAW1NK74_9CHLO